MKFNKSRQNYCPAQISQLPNLVSQMPPLLLNGSPKNVIEWRGKKAFKKFVPTDGR
jgi:hypothetical protein